MKEVKSKVPSCKWVTGSERGESSDCRTDVKDVKAEVMVDSERWKAGERLDIMEGVKRRIDGLGVGDGV